MVLYTLTFSEGDVNDPGVNAGVSTPKNLMIRYKFNHMKIKLRRIELGIQQQTLARELGIHRQSLCDIEKGRNTPGMKTMLRICSLLDLKPSDLISSESEGYEPTVSSSIPFQT